MSKEIKLISIANEAITREQVERKVSSLAQKTWDMKFHNGWKQPLYEINEETFTKDVEQAYVVLNTWFNMFQDLTHLDTSFIREYYWEFDLFDIFSQMDNLKEEFLKRHSKGEGSFKDVWRSVLPYGHPMHYMLDSSSISDWQIMMFASYTKRTPLQGLNSTGLMCDKFLKNQDRLSILDWTRPTITLICSQMRHVIDCIFYGVKVDDTNFILPPGQFLENLDYHFDNTPELKFEFLSKYASDLPVFLRRFFPSTGNWSIPDYNALQVVPKNYKSGRTIAIESVAKTYAGYLLSEELTKRLTRRDKPVPFYVSMWDGQHKLCNPTFGCYYNYQKSNQNWALLGSMLDNVATIDSSMASDSISLELLRLILPERIFEYCVKWRSARTILPTRKGTSKDLVTAFTMGHPLTYPIESVVFYAAAVVGTCWYLGIDVFSFQPKNRLLDLPVNEFFLCINAIGDDLTCHSMCAQTVIEILEAIGFIVNTEKTFIKGAYRESCGKEYWLGNDVTSLYFPRGTSKDRLTELIELQHKLVHYPTSDSFLKSFIRKYYRSTVTSSWYGSPYLDFWSFSKEKDKESDLVHQKPRKFIRKYKLDASFWSKVAGKRIQVDRAIKFWGDRYLGGLETPYMVELTVKEVDTVKVHRPTTLTKKFIKELDWRLLRCFLFYNCDREDWYQIPEIQVPEAEWFVKNGYLTKSSVDGHLIDTETLMESAEQNDCVVHTAIKSTFNRSTSAEEYTEALAYVYALSRTSPTEKDTPYGAKGLDYSLDIRTQVSSTTESTVKNKKFLF